MASRFMDYQAQRNRLPGVDDGRMEQRHPPRVAGLLLGLVGMLLLFADREALGVSDLVLAALVFIAAVALGVRPSPPGS